MSIDGDIYSLYKPLIKEPEKHKCIDCNYSKLGINIENDCCAFKVDGQDNPITYNEFNGLPIGTVNNLHRIINSQGLCPYFKTYKSSRV